MRTQKALEIAVATVDALILVGAKEREILIAYADEEKAREHAERSASVRIRKELPAIAAAYGLVRESKSRRPHNFTVD